MGWDGNQELVEGGDGGGGEGGQPISAHVSVPASATALHTHAPYPSPLLK